MFEILYVLAWANGVVYPVWRGNAKACCSGIDFGQHLRLFYIFTFSISREQKLASCRGKKTKERSTIRNLTQDMAKIYLNTRDNLTVINPDLIAAVQAQGNYSDIVYINKHRITVTLSISRLENILRQDAGNAVFVRLGRSLVINHSMLYSINIPQQYVELSADGLNRLRIRLSKKLLKTYKTTVIQTLNKHQHDDHT